MEKLAKNKPLFIGLSSLAISCLIGSFAHPLQQLEIWRQVEIGSFNIQYEKNFILTENDLNYPYGFNEKKAVKVGQIYRDYKLEKIFLLSVAAITAMYANSLGQETCINDEIDNEVATIKAKGKKELLLEKVKHRLAMASKSQRMLFLDEMKALVDEFGTLEGEIQEADELNATDKFISANYLLLEGHPIDIVVNQTWGYQVGTPEHSEMKRKFIKWQDQDDQTETTLTDSQVSESLFRNQFPESMDSISWNAIKKALNNDSTKEEVIKDVLECNNSIGEAYYDFLVRKFGNQ
jgi:hypothetical protein